MIPGKGKAVSSGWKPFSEVDSHRNSLGSNEKKMFEFSDFVIEEYNKQCLP